jgi:glycosyltransferase involved in cell wall biosynthesis
LPTAKCGVLVATEAPDDLADAIVGLREAPDVAAAMGEAGYRRLVERYSVDRMVEGTLAVYERIVTRRFGFTV